MALFYLYPTDIPTIDSGWSGGSRPPCVYSQINDLYGQWNDDLTTGCIHWLEDTAGALSSAAGYKVLVTFQQLPPVFSVANVRIFYRIERDSSTYNGQEFKPALWIGGTAYLPSGVAGFAQANYGFYNLAYDFAVNPATTVAWTRADINVAGLGAMFARNTDVTRTNGLFVSAMTLIVDAIGQPMQLASATAVASRAQRRYTSPQRTVQVNVPYEVGLNVGPNDVLPVSHFGGSDGSHNGWGQNFWQYLPAQLTDIDINPDGSVTTKGLDIRPMWCLFYDSMWPLSLSPLLNDGVVRIYKAATRTFVRASGAYAQDPASRQYLSISNDQENFESRGELFEGASSNLIQYSAFQTGSFTGWTAVGVGDHGSAITPEAPGSPAAGSPAVMWDPNTTGVNQCALFTGGTTGWASDVYLKSTATPSIAAFKTVCVSYWYSNPVDGQSPQVALQRAIDGWYYNFTSLTWQAGIAWKAVPTGSPGVVQRYDAYVSVGGGATTLQAYVGLAVGIAVSGSLPQQSRFHCVQIDDTKQSFNSPIITTNATGTKAAGMLQFTNNSGARVIDLSTSWTLALEWVPMFTDFQDTTHDHFLYCMRTNGSGNDFFTLAYIGATGIIRVRLNRAGVSTDLTWNIVHGPEYAPGIQYGSPLTLCVRQTQLGEFGETANTVSLFYAYNSGIAGKVASAVISPPVLGAATTVTIGSDSTVGVSAAEAVIRKVTVLQYAATDIECSRLI